MLSSGRWMCNEIWQEIQAVCAATIRREQSKKLHQSSSASSTPRFPNDARAEPVTVVTSSSAAVIWQLFSLVANVASENWNRLCEKPSKPIRYSWSPRLFRNEKGEGTHDRFRFICKHRDRWPVKITCEVLQMSETGYYTFALFLYFSRISNTTTAFNQNVT